LIDLTHSLNEPAKQAIAIIGAGGLGRELRVFILELISNGHPFDFVGFYDDHVAIGAMINGSPVLGSVADLAKVNEELALAIAIGDPLTRRSVFDRLSNPLLSFPTLVHPKAYLGENERVNIGEGSIISAGTIFTTDISIGRFVLINNGVLLGHDSVVGDFASVMPGARLSGHVKLGEGAFIGTGASLINGASVGQYSTIGAGAAVIDAIPDHSTAVGVPAKVIKQSS
jgi:sugar O-acyltransferase (sialic acid O-acetyltransferase NeuD family)